MPNRLEHEFPHVDLQVLPAIDPTDPSGALRRLARRLRAERQRAALVWLAQKLQAAVAGTARWTRRRPRPVPHAVVDRG